MKNKALFLDLNGTIIEPKSGKLFSEYLNGWKFLDGILPKLREYYNNGYKLIIVTNQAGIGKGLVNPTEYYTLLEEVRDAISLFINQDYGNQFADYIYVPVYTADTFEHPYRKPRPDAAYAARDKFKIDLSKSLFVGDASGLTRIKEHKEVKDFSDSDKMFAENAGIPYMDIEEFLK